MFGNLLTFDVDGSSLSLVETGATRRSSVEATMNQIIGQTIDQYAGAKAATWSGKVADTGTPARNEAKTFKKWSVKVVTSSSSAGTIMITLTKSG